VLESSVTSEQHLDPAGADAQLGRADRKVRIPIAVEVAQARAVPNWSAETDVVALLLTVFHGYRPNADPW
jgi:hypothetical protein